jgi:hypothetical protein
MGKSGATGTGKEISSVFCDMEIDSSNRVHCCRAKQRNFF